VDKAEDGGKGAIAGGMAFMAGRSAVAGASALGDGARLAGEQEDGTMTAWRSHRAASWSTNCHAWSTIELDHVVHLRVCGSRDRFIRGSVRTATSGPTMQPP